MATNGSSKDMEAFIDNFEKNGIPLGKSGTPDQMADTVFYLAETGFITGK
jgi:hypothetical protein